VDQLGFRLYLITDRAASARPPVDIVEECLAAGLRAVQLREKDLEARPLLAMAGALREATRAHGARLLINDRADVALAAGADGVQRAYSSLPVTALRAITPRGFLVGASTHSLGEARQAEADGADFIVFGPVYDTPSKRAYGPPQGLAALEGVAGALARPVIAVGGLTPARVAEVLAAGAAGVAVIRDIYAAERPADRTKAFLDALGSP
jgi:thiamine-phosphate pyrophosphorylase